MIFLHYGDRLPSVAVMQRLINECREMGGRFVGVRELVEDGIFGRNTRAAVKALQDAFSVRPDNGVFGPSTWRALADYRKCKIVDVTDLVLETKIKKLGHRKAREFLTEHYKRRLPKASRGQVEASVERMMRKTLKEIRDCRDQHNRFVAHGGEPIAITDVKDTFGTIRRGIAARSRDGWRVVMLRFTGHGGPASQGVAGTAYIKARVYITPDMLRFDDDDTAEELVETVVIGGMTMSMANFGCIELHGCNVGARRKVRRGKNRILLNGPAYVQNFADLLGRPVSATTIGDYYGSLKLDTRFEGPIVSCMPGGGTVREWFKEH